MHKTSKVWPTTPLQILSSARAKTNTVVILVILAGLAFLTFRTSSDVHYVLVIDSGSTGTRIVAYKWKENPGQAPIVNAVVPQTAQQKVPTKAAGDVRAYDRVETEPGLDKFVNDAAGLWTSALQPLLAWAEDVVPRKLWQDTPVFLFGTAGLRVLTPESQSTLLRNIQNALQGSPFRFEPSWAKVISGVEEGVYGWIALNYLTGHLVPNAGWDEDSDDSSPDGRGEGSGTVGAVDLGGSSLEVSFVPGDSTHAGDSQVNVTVLGTEYSLYTYVHHSYGLNDAFDRSVAHLLSTLQPEQMDSETDTLLQDSIQFKPLEQDDTAITALDPAEGRSRSILQGSYIVPRSNPSPQPQAAVPVLSLTQQSLSPVPSSRPSPQTQAAAPVLGPRQQSLSPTLGSSDTDARVSVVGSQSEGRSAEIAQEGGHLVSEEGQLVNSSELLQPGLKLAGARSRSMLQGRITVDHPCLHEGYSKEYVWVAHGAHVAPLPQVQLLGRPDWGACQALAAAVVNASQPCPSPEGACAMGAFQPVPSQTMYAVTGFFVVYQFFHLPSSASLADLEEAGQQFCNTPWSSINAERGAEIHVDRYCFRVPYITQLLREGLGLPESQISIGSGKEGWTLGAALAEGSKAHLQNRSTSSSSAHGAWPHVQPMVWAALALFVTISLALFVYINCAQGVSDSSSDAGLSNKSTPDHNFRWSPSHGLPSSVEKLSLRIPSPSPFSSMEPVTVFQAANMGGKFSPPPFRQHSSRQHGHQRQASMPRLASIASGGHRKRQLSFSSLDTLATS
ncbi:hypothetical protein WJX77_012567 [Trebouxia sp. C0004]